MTALALVHKVQRAALGLYAVYAGALALLTLVVPRLMARELSPSVVSSTAIVYSQLWAGMRLTVALIALVAALAPKPPRALVWAVAIGLIASLVGLELSGALTTVPWPELKPYWRWNAVEALVALVLTASGVARAILRRRIAR